MQVEIQSIKKHFGPVKANDGISCMFEAGKIYGLLGENGAGKSTLMKILSGFQPPDSGQILLNDQPASFRSPIDALAAGVGMLYQDPLDLPPFSVIENFLLGRDTALQLPLRQSRAEIAEVAQRYGFEVDLDARIDTLSLGQRQQLELVRLLIGGAQALILDEPTTGISAEQKDSLFESMRQMAHEEGKVLILVSHKLSEVQELCDHAYVLRQGKLVGGMDIPCDNQDLVNLMFEQLPPRAARPSIDLGETVLSVEDVSIATYRLQVKNVSLSVQAGEVFGLAGLEGSGQSLLLKACAGLFTPNEGRILINGQDVTSSGYHSRRGIGVSFIGAGRLEEGLVAGLSLQEHMALASPQDSLFVDWTAAHHKTHMRIEEYQVIGYPESGAEQLSGGNQQRFMFSMLNHPLNLILLEQPTRGLDVRSTNWIWERMYQVCAEGAAVMFISADLDEIIDRSDRIAVFSGGRMSRIVNAADTSVDELGHMIGGQTE